eukprot:3216552-Amphidinium_carterae.1
MDMCCQTDTVLEDVCSFLDDGFAEEDQNQLQSAWAMETKLAKSRFAYHYNPDDDLSLPFRTFLRPCFKFGPPKSLGGGSQKYHFVLVCASVECSNAGKNAGCGKFNQETQYAQQLWGSILGEMVLLISTNFKHTHTPGVKSKFTPHKHDTCRIKLQRESGSATLRDHGHDIDRENVHSAVSVRP